MEFVPLPYFQSKSKCILNDLELPETRLPHVLKSVTKTDLVPPPPRKQKILHFFKMKASFSYPHTISHLAGLILSFNKVFLYYFLLTLKLFRLRKWARPYL